MFESNPFQGIKVAVLGDLMVDRFIYGEVHRISPEAPVPVVAVTGRNSMLGGAGNTAANLKSLDAQPLVVGRLGDDNGGEAFKGIAEKLGISTDYIIKGDVWSSFKTRVIARTQQVVRFDEEDTTALNARELADAIAQLKRVRQQTNVLVVSDYMKGMVTQKLYDAAKEIFKDGIVLVDPARKHVVDYSGATGLKPNMAELYEMMPEITKVKTDEQAGEAARLMCEKYDLEHVLLTRSGDGMTLWSNGHVDHLKTIAKEIVDVSGAGDTVMATFSAAVAAGIDLKEAAHYANVAGGVVVEKLGTASITWAELATELKNQQGTWEISKSA